MADIIIAPFSNSDIRDWQAEHYRDLIRLLLEAPAIAGAVRIIGTRSQCIRAAEIVRPFQSERVINDCGRLSWGEVETLLRTADCVIGNNSGIAHLAAHLGVPTVCVFSGAHQRTEWRPLGFNVALVSRAVGCAPCMLHREADCPYGKSCLDLITPEIVRQAVFVVMDRVKGMNRRLGETPFQDARPYLATQDTVVA